MLNVIVNKVRCKKCNDIIESKHTHDLQYCKCKSIYIDGGTDYQRYGGNIELIDFSYSVYGIEVISGRRDGMIKLEMPLSILKNLEEYFIEAEQANFIGKHHDILKTAIQSAIEQAELGGVKSSKKRD